VTLKYLRGPDLSRRPRELVLGLDSPLVVSATNAGEATWIAPPAGMSAVLLQITTEDNDLQGVDDGMADDLEHEFFHDNLLSRVRGQSN
jgi:hypothetical protein